MNPSLIEKRKWNSYPNKTFQTFKVYEIILNKRWGNCDKRLPWNCSRLEPLRFYGLIVFVAKNIHVCIVKSVLVFCIVLQYFLCYFYLIMQDFIEDNNENHGRRNETTLYFRLKTCWRCPQKREHQTSTSLRARRARSLFWTSREKSRIRWRECEGRSERRSLAPSFAF